MKMVIISTKIFSPEKNAAMVSTTEIDTIPDVIFIEIPLISPKNFSGIFPIPAKTGSKKTAVNKSNSIKKDCLKISNLF